MKHQALSSALAVFLTFLCLIQLAVGILGIKDAQEDREITIINAERLQTRLDNYLELTSELEADDFDYDTAVEALETRREQHNSDASDHRMELSMYTATRSGEIQGADALWEAKAQVAAGLSQLETAEAEYQAQLESFEQLKQTMPMLQQLKQMVDPIIGSLSASSGTVAAAIAEEEPTPELIAAADGAYMQTVFTLAALQSAPGYDMLCSAGAEMGADINGAVSGLLNYSDGSGALRKAEDGSIAEDVCLGILGSYDSAVAALGTLSAAAMSDEDIAAAEAALTEAGEQLKAGRKQLEEADWTIQYNLELIWYELGQLDKQKAELEETRDSLLIENTELTELQERIDAHDALTKKHKGAKNYLMANTAVSEAVDEGMELEAAADFVHTSMLERAEHEYEYRRIACYIAIAAAVFGIFSMLGTFEAIRINGFIFCTALLCMLASAGAEYVYRTLDIGSMYITVITPIFALLLALTVIPGKKKNIV